jgi:hypothetical protein
MNSVRLFQITNDDLVELERVLPELSESLAVTEEYSPRIRSQLRRVQTILSNVRWGYGPPTHVERVGGPDEDQTS